jgi:hypothetical protein
MKATRLKDGTVDGYIRLRLPRGVLLVLPVTQYVAGLRRGKAERRAQRFATHSHDTQVTYEPQAWTTKEGHYGPRYPDPERP